MRFSDFVVFDQAARAIFADPMGQRKCRACLTKLAETAEQNPERFMAEAAKKDVRKGVAFRQKSLDDQETGVFAQRLADRLPTKPAKGNYGDFLHQSVRAQGDALGSMQWDTWEITKKALELGGVNPDDLNDPQKSPAQRMALVSKIDWQNVTLPRLKAKLGPSFRVDDGWKRTFGIERLKRIKYTVEQGQAINDPHEKRLLGVWRTLEVQLRGQTLPAGHQNNVGMTRLPMSGTDRTRFYKTLTGTNESVKAPLELSAESAYDYLMKYGVQVVTDAEATDAYLTRILDDLRNNSAFVPSSAKGSEADRKRWRDSAARSWGGFLPAARGYDPSNAPGVAQRLTGLTTRGHKTRANPSGRRVPYAYPEPEEFEWPGKSDEMPGIKYVIDAPSQEVPNEGINAYYRSGTRDANDAVQRELMKPAQDAVMWLRKKGWISDPSKIDDYAQDVAMAMMGRSGAVENWRSNVGFRRSTAMMLAKRYVSQGWPSETKQRTGQLRGDEDRPGALDSATTSNRNAGEDEFSRVRGGAARAREAIQRAIASMLDLDTADMGEDEEAFVDALESLNDPDRAIAALDVLDQLSTRYERELPQVKRAVDRIKRHLDPLLGKVRGVA